MGASRTWFTLILSGTAEEAELIHNIANSLLYYISPILFVLLYFVLPSPYGKLNTSHWKNLLGPGIPSRWAWFLFEVPNLLWVVATLWKHRRHSLTLQKQQTNISLIMTATDKEVDDDDVSFIGNYILLGFFTLHYLRRTLWYPYRMSPHAKPVPSGVVLSAMSYTSVNG